MAHRSHSWRSWLDGAPVHARGYSGRAPCLSPMRHSRLVSGVDSAKTHTVTPDTRAEKFESFERINSIRETNGNFDSCNSCKRLVPSRLHELHESKCPFVSRIEFIRSKLSNFSAHVSGVALSLARDTRPRQGRRRTLGKVTEPGRESDQVCRDVAGSGQVSEARETCAVDKKWSPRCLDIKSCHGDVRARSL